MAYHIENHRLHPAEWIPSPNFNHRPQETEIDLLVIHNISLPPKQFGGSAVIDFFTNQLDIDQDSSFASLVGLHVSAHLFIRRDGGVIQFVAFNERAWHAGESVYAGRSNCNDFSIGIELEGSDDILYEPIQYTALAEITAALMQHYPITFDRIVGHSTIAPLRKTDPGPAFDWNFYRQLLDENFLR